MLQQSSKLLFLFNRFSALPAKRQWLVVHTLLLAVLLRAALRFFSLRTILTWLQKFSKFRTSRRPQPVEDIQYAITAVGRRLPLATCLTNGMAGQYLLTRNGYSPTLHIGVKKESASLLAAHAWVTIDQQVVIGMIDDLDTYTTLPGIG